MDDKFSFFLEKDRLKSEEEKRELIYEMTKVMNSEELTSTIEEMSSFYLLNELDEYMVDAALPDEDSTEFRFLVQAKMNNGNIARKEMRRLGINTYAMKKFIRKYNLQEIANGIYLFPNKPIDGPFLFQMQYTKAVISHETALYYLGLSDVIPKQAIMSMPRNYKLSQICEAKDALTDFRMIYLPSEDDKSEMLVEYEENDPILVIGNHPIEEPQIVQCQTFFNNPVRVTSAERSIVDVLKPAAKTEEEIKVEALKRYFAEPAAKPNRLRRIADELKVLKELDRHLWKLRAF